MLWGAAIGLLAALAVEGVRWVARRKKRPWAARLLAEIDTPVDTSIASRPDLTCAGWGDSGGGDGGSSD